MQPELKKILMEDALSLDKNKMITIKVPGEHGAKGEYAAYRLTENIALLHSYADNCYDFTSFRSNYKYVLTCVKSGVAIAVVKGTCVQIRTLAKKLEKISDLSFPLKGYEKAFTEKELVLMWNEIEQAGVLA